MATIKHLLLDQGNTRCKAAIVKDGVFDIRPSSPDLRSILELYSLDEFSGVMISSTAHIPNDLEAALRKRENCILLDHSTPLPIGIDYDSPESLGPDRRANACGLHQLAPGKNTLAVDIGTCITYDLVVENRFVGGAIAPGLRLRNRAMNDYTSKLPIVSLEEKMPLLGKTTNTCLQSGIIHGMNAEIHGMIDQYRESYPQLEVYITGGDSKYFDMGLKNFIFADANLTLRGLHSILQFNGH